MGKPERRENTYHYSNTVPITHKIENLNLDPHDKVLIGSAYAVTTCSVFTLPDTYTSEHTSLASVVGDDGSITQHREAFYSRVLFVDPSGSKSHLCKLLLASYIFIHSFYFILFILHLIMQGR